MNSFINIMREPDDILVESEGSGLRFEERAERKSGDAAVSYNILDNTAVVEIKDVKVPIKRVKLRWNSNNSKIVKVLCDSWERTTGEIIWSSIRPQAALPWYFAAYDGEVTHCYGVKTDTNAMCFWQIDTRGITLWLDVRNGSNGTEPEGILKAATVATRQGKSGESAFEACQDFCRMMCEKPNLPAAPVFGFNNWYWAYGEICEESVKAEADLLEELSRDCFARPYMVIDDGWQRFRYNNGSGRYIGGPWDAPGRGFENMEDTADYIKNKSCRPGIWFRPLQTMENLPGEMVLKSKDAGPGQIMDPSHPETLKKISGDVNLFTQWGYELIKHDFTTIDLFGSAFGNESDFSFFDKTKTNAMIIRELYSAIQNAAGNALVIGCNTYNHIAAGIHQIQRTGGDTSGNLWEHTRRNGVNAFMRLYQNNTFFNVDPDCAAFTKKVPTLENMEFLRLCAISGSTAFASVTPGILDKGGKKRIAEIFKTASQKGNEAQPLDWMNTNTPCIFLYKGKKTEFDWYSYYNGVRTFCKWLD